MSQEWATENRFLSEYSQKRLNRNDFQSISWVQKYANYISVKRAISQSEKGHKFPIPISIFDSHSNQIYVCLFDSCLSFYCLSKTTESSTKYPGN